MPIYNVNGSTVSNAYDLQGNAITQAYDINGNPLMDASYNLTVMTYNVQRFSGRNAIQEMQERILEAYKPDIVGLQELGSGSMPSLGVALFSDYANQFLGNDTNKSGIISKYALSNPTFTAYTQKAGENRGYEKAYITVNGKQVALFNTHIETIASYSVHVAQMKQLFDDIQTEHTFIAIGDFNAETHSVNDAEYTDTIKQFIDAGYNMANWDGHFTDSWFNNSTVANSNYKCPCDNIITSQNISIDEVIFDPIKLEYVSGSIDHISVTAFLNVK